jgi:hypothetical protein
MMTSYSFNALDGNMLVWKRVTDVENSNVPTGALMLAVICLCFYLAVTGRQLLRSRQNSDLLDNTSQSDAGKVHLS